MIFDTFEEALVELDEFLYDMTKAYNMGDISILEDRENFRIVRAHHG